MNIDYQVIKTNKKIEYINIPCSFDIETTSTYIDDEKVAYMYIYMLGINDENNILIGRTWEEFKNHCKQLKDYFNLSDTRRLVIYVHNLGYEFQFMRKYFNWVDVFSISERKPLKAITDIGIEFRDSYLLSGYSLENTAKNLQNKTIKKLTGNLDYTLKRNYFTKMTKEEMDYCINDVVIILEYIKEQIQIYGDITKIPLTNTGRVRKFVRDKCYFTSKSHKKSSGGKFTKYRKIMNDLTLDTDVYRMLKRGFMGGFTHASSKHSGKIIEKVSSIDFTSSYPAVMLTEKFPMGKGIKVKVKSVKDFNNLLNKYCLLFDVRFTNLQCIYENENYISESKCFTLQNPIINNGRVYSADTLATTITDVDFKILKQIYRWDDMEIGNCYKFYKGYLPKPIIQSIVELYQKKTELKGVKGSEVEYLLSKGMLNSTYGMTVTDIVRDKITYNNDWGLELVNPDEAIETYNKSVGRFLYYAWGVWVTAYARQNLWSGILSIGNDYIYSDTDSIKLTNYDEHLPYIKWYNNMVIDKLKIMCNHYNIDFELLQPKTIQGVPKLIGVWDFDGYYKRFKTLGAKRYLVQYDDGNFEMTVAGLSKSNGIKYLEMVSKETGTDIFDLFNDDMYIPSDYTSKNTHTYIDTEYSFDDIDYQGNLARIETLSGVHLEKTDFTLSISKIYIDFLQNLEKGYLYRGLSFK